MQNAYHAWTTGRCSSGIVCVIRNDLSVERYPESVWSAQDFDTTALFGEAAWVSMTGFLPPRQNRLAVRSV